jgi:hypothetical protein
MKTPQSLVSPSNGVSGFPTVVWILITAMLAGVFWLVTTTSSMGATCTVCHKNVQTLSFPCNSLDYKRHKDHGDPDGACSGTTGSKPSDSKLSKEKPSS